MNLIRHHFECINSTNTWAKANASLFPKNSMILVTAEEQTAGRGRFKRTWISPPKENIYASFCFFVDPSSINLGNIPQILALSVYEILKKIHLNPHLKWPNDIVVSAKKIGGILAETTSVHNDLCMILGLGVNVNMPIDALTTINQPATSLFAESSQLFDVETILQEITHTFIENYQLFLENGFSFFLDKYRQASAIYINKLIHFHDNLQVHTGFFHDIQENGTLLLRLPDGSLKTFIVGEFI